MPRISTQGRRNRPRIKAGILRVINYLKGKFRTPVWTCRFCGNTLPRYAWEPMMSHLEYSHDYVGDIATAIREEYV